MWYVIEHLTGLRAALAQVNALLEPGGVFAFSTPSFAGISRRKSLTAFLRNSPGDHWTIWDPRRCKKMLAAYGFKVKKIVVTGHHPERFNKMISRVLGLGDTFECYAIKVKSL
jgi:2-polyprenyl-3-methyl-5-hydroxy-6-metoxy-1,4-benzoquinol methylase